MSKRAKFVLVTWVGPNVSVMKKAKMSTDKALMKDVIQVRIIFFLISKGLSFPYFSISNFTEHVSGTSIRKPRRIQP